MVRQLALVLALALAIPALAQTPTPPPQAVAQGYIDVLFNQDWTTSGNVWVQNHVSCAGTPQTKVWKQGLWWEGQWPTCNNGPTSQIQVVTDPLIGHHVLDLIWLATQTDPQSNTAITTFPLDEQSPHFAFRHGYVEVVARAPYPNAAAVPAGYWPSAFAGSDQCLMMTDLPPFAGGFNCSVEHDFVEIYGPNTFPGNPNTLYDAAIHENYSGGTNNFLANSVLPVDQTQYHKYGYLFIPAAHYGQGGVCAYIDDIQQGSCQGTTGGTDGEDLWPILTLQAGCSANVHDHSCITVPRMDWYVSRITVFSANLAEDN